MGTWEDIEVESRDCPVLHRLVSADRLSLDEREQLLVDFVLWLSRDRRERIEAHVELMKRVPGPRYVLPEQGGHDGE